MKGNPPQQLEWDQKLWWVHVEALVALAKGYRYTGDERCLEWFKKVHEYTWKHFKDADYSEWFGYLNRRGEVLLPLKGVSGRDSFMCPGHYTRFGRRSRFKFFFKPRSTKRRKHRGRRDFSATSVFPPLCTPWLKKLGTINASITTNQN